MNHIVIVGAGITGLAAAYRLRHAAPNVAITLIEKEATPGGKIQTERTDDGYVIEAGPDSFLSRKPRGVGLARDIGLSERLQGRNPRFSDAFIKRRGALHPLPEGITGMVPTKLDALERSDLLSEEGRARWAAESTIPPRRDEGDESIAAFMTRRMGQEVFDEIIEPLMVGIYAGDATRLSIQATFPNLCRIEQDYGSLLAGLAQTSAPANGDTLPPFVTLPSGTAELVETLVAQLKPTVDFRFGCAVVALGKQKAETVTHPPTPFREGEAESRVDSLTHHAPRTTHPHTVPNAPYTLTLSDGTTLHADGVILATPAFVTADMVEGIDPELAALHRRIPYASSVIVTLAFSDEDTNSSYGLAGRGYIVPTIEDTEVLAVTASSNKWQGRAPDGATLFRVFIGRSGKSDPTRYSDESLIEMARTELRETLGITTDPRLTRVQRWHHGMPQYTLGHLDRLAAIEARLEQHPRLALAGAAYRGVGIPDCIASGEAAAERVMRTMASETLLAPT